MLASAMSDVTMNFQLSEKNSMSVRTTLEVQWRLSYPPMKVTGE